MANEIKVVYETGATLDFSVYYDNSGTMTAREDDQAMTEEPAGSGVYKGTPSGMQSGDIVVIEEGATIIGSNEYYPEVNVKEVNGAAQTANDNGADINAILVDTSTTLPAEHVAIEGKCDTVVTAVSTTIPATITIVTADTNELQADLTNGGRLDLILDAILEDTGTTLENHFTDVKGTGFVKDTDSLVDLAHIGADSDTLETLSDEIAGIATAAGQPSIGD